MSAASLILMFQSLEVIVEHSRMTDQAHLFGSLHVARSDHGATPGADNIERRLQVFQFVALRIYVSTHAELSKQIAFPTHQ